MMSLVPWEAPWHISHWEGLGYIPAFHAHPNRYGLYARPLLSPTPSFLARPSLHRFCSTPLHRFPAKRIPPITHTRCHNLTAFLSSQVKHSMRSHHQSKIQNSSSSTQAKQSSRHCCVYLEHLFPIVKKELHSLKQGWCTQRRFLPQSSCKIRLRCFGTHQVFKLPSQEFLILELAPACTTWYLVWWRSRISHECRIQTKTRYYPLLLNWVDFIKQKRRRQNQLPNRLSNPLSQ